MMKSRKRRGYSLIELVIAIVIMSMIMFVIYNTIFLAMESKAATAAEFEYQTDIRNASDHMKREIDRTKAVFLMNDNDFRTVPKQPRWDYYAISDDGKQLIYYEYDPSSPDSSPKHSEKAILSLPAGGNTSLKFNFEKQMILTDVEKEAAKKAGMSEEQKIKEKLAIYQNGKYNSDPTYKPTADEKAEIEKQDDNHFLKLSLYLLDEEGEVLRDLTTEMEAKGAYVVGNARDLQNLDTNPINVIAVRSKGEHKVVNDKPVYITLLLDRSPSMLWNVDGSKKPSSFGAYPGRDYISRFDSLLNAVTGRERIDSYGNNLPAKKGFIDELAGKSNVYMTVIPFGSTANYPNTELIEKIERKSGDIERTNHPIYNLENATDLSRIKAEIETLDGNDPVDELASDSVNRYERGIEYDYASGIGTNIGDALRRAYYYHADVAERLNKFYSVDKNPKDFLEYTILFTDGCAKNLTQDSSSVSSSYSGFTHRFDERRVKLKNDDGPVWQTEKDWLGRYYKWQRYSPTLAGFVDPRASLTKSFFMSSKTYEYAKERAEQMKNIPARDKNGLSKGTKQIKSFVIAFAPSSTMGSSSSFDFQEAEAGYDQSQELARIMKHPESSKNFYSYKQVDDLPKIFKDIAVQISSDLEIYRGPYPPK